MIKNKTAIIIDDEELARELIKSYLKNFPNINIISECENGYEGLKAINELKPDIVFLDIQMPKINGFEMLELLDSFPEIIFITAYNQYAIKAFEMNAVDYLLKPFSNERFNQAVDKALNRIEKNSSKSFVKQLVTHVDQNSKQINRIVVKVKKNIKVIPVEKIIYIEAQDDYVMIYTEDGKYLKPKTMKLFETVLDTSIFVRIHRSYIVNINFISQLELYAKESYLVILNNGNKIKASKAGYQKLKNILNI